MSTPLEFSYDVFDKKFKTVIGLKMHKLRMHKKCTVCNGFITE